MTTSQQDQYIAVAQIIRQGSVKAETVDRQGSLPDVTAWLHGFITSQIQSVEIGRIVASV